MKKEKARTFESGAIRNSDDGKLKIHRLLSPKVLIAFVDYLNRNKIASDGTTREPDNWKLGIPNEEYMASLTRHFFDVWARYEETGDVSNDELLAVAFNAMGIVFNEVKGVKWEN